MTEQVVATPLADGPRRRQSRMRLYGIGIAAVVLIGGVAAFFLSNRTPEPAPVAETEPVEAAPVETPPFVAEVVTDPVPEARVAAPARAPVAKAAPVRSAPRETVVAAPEPAVEPAPVPVPVPEIRIAPAPVGPSPTPAQPQPTDPDAPIVTRPQPLDG